MHVTDSYGGDLGTVTATNPHCCSCQGHLHLRPATESGVAGKCTKYDNTATITETDQSADETVKSVSAGPDGKQDGSWHL